MTLRHLGERGGGECGDIDFRMPLGNTSSDSESCLREKEDYFPVTKSVVLWTAKYVIFPWERVYFLVLQFKVTMTGHPLTPLGTSLGTPLGTPTRDPHSGPHSGPH